MTDRSDFYAHLIFSTKGWEPLITRELLPEIIERLTRNFQSRNSRLMLAEGGEEHLHILGKFTSKIPFSRIIGWSKGECSHWLNRTHKGLGFYWQKGFWYESIKEDGLKKVEKYIHNQNEVHQEITFFEEIEQFRKGWNWDKMS